MLKEVKWGGKLKKLERLQKRQKLEKVMKFIEKFIRVSKGKCWALNRVKQLAATLPRK